MKSLKDIAISQSWLERLYSEAWNQYRHEDDIEVRRMQVFTAVEAGLVAVVALIARPMLALSPVVAGANRFHIGLTALAGFMIMIGILLCFLAFVWRSAAKAGRRYLNLRWIPIYALEKYAQINDLSIAAVEDEWRRVFKEPANRKKEFAFYRDIKELAGRFKLGSVPPFRGWTSIEAVTWAFQIISVLLVIAGVGLIFLTRAVWTGSIQWPG